VTRARRRLAGLALVAAAAAVALLVAVSVGPSRLGLGDLVAAVAGGGDAASRSILFDIRLARVLLAACVGAALSVAGCAYQAVLRNPLADPYILGVSGGAALGAVIFIAAAPAAVLSFSAGRPAAISHSPRVIQMPSTWLRS